MRSFRHISILPVSLSMLLLLLSCSGKSSRESREEMVNAAHYGREQALRLAPRNQPDTLEMENVLIEVRVTETRLREHGEDKIADEYITSFLSTLDSINPSLRAELLQ